LREDRRPKVTHDDVQRWLDAYVEAWRTYDPAAIAALFTEDATYAYHPWDEGEDVVRGRDAIVADWLEEQDEPGSWEAYYQPLMVEGRRAVATGTTRYANGRFYWNLFVLRFAEDRRCAEFVEWFMTQPPGEMSH
jgi:SnoaL-like domain